MIDGKGIWLEAKKKKKKLVTVGFQPTEAPALTEIF